MKALAIQLSDSASQQPEVNLVGNETNPDGSTVAVQCEFRVDELEELDLQQCLALDGDREVERDILHVTGATTSQLDNGQIHRSRDLLKVLQGMEIKVEDRA